MVVRADPQVKPTRPSMDGPTSRHHRHWDCRMPVVAVTTDGVIWRCRRCWKPKDWKSVPPRIWARTGPDVRGLGVMPDAAAALPARPSQIPIPDHRNSASAGQPVRRVPRGSPPDPAPPPGPFRIQGSMIAGLTPRMPTAPIYTRGNESSRRPWRGALRVLRAVRHLLPQPRRKLGMLAKVSDVD